MKHFPIIYQNDAGDCGVAALATIAQYYGTTYSLNYLRELAKTNQCGTNILGIVEAAHQLNFDTLCIEADKELFNAHDLTYPFIAHILRDDNMPHFVVIYHIKNNKLLIADPDPAFGKHWIDIKLFLKQWTGNTILLTPGTTFIDQKKSQSNLKSFLQELLKSKSKIIFGVLFSMIITIINLSSSYVIQKTLDKYIPNSKVHDLSLVFITLGIAYLFQQFLYVQKELILEKFSQKLTFMILFKYINHLFKLSMSFFYNRQAGDVLTRFTDANHIIELLSLIHI